MKSTAGRDRLKSVLVVAITTVFIWLVADQYVLETQAFKIPVRVVSPDPERYAAIAGPPYQVTLNVTMLGRRRHLTALNDLINATNCFAAVIDETAVSSEPQSISTLDGILDNIGEIKEMPLSIKSVSPATTLVRIDHYEEIRNVGVLPDTGDLKVVNPTCSPDKVSVRLPRFAADRLLNERVLRPKAEGAVQEAMGSGPTFRVPLRLSLDADPALEVRITPEQVTFSGVVAAQNATAVKGPVQVTFSIPEEVQRRFVVEAVPGTQFRRSIEVTGRKDLLEQLDPRDIRAFVDVMAADMDEPGRQITRSVQYILPPGFTRASQAPAHEVVFKLIPLPGAPPPGD